MFGGIGLVSTTMSSSTPLFELFLDLPHPHASQECPGAFLIPAPHLQTTELATPEQVTRFAFPELLITPNHPEQQQHNTRLNKYDVYGIQNTSFSFFTFSWQTADGSRLHGHVRRYLPPHLIARTRYDVGRRGERALVILTRHSNTALFSAILKYVKKNIASLLEMHMLCNAFYIYSFTQNYLSFRSIEAISSQQVATSGSAPPIHNGNPQQWFLNNLYQQSHHTITITNLEFANENYATVDRHSFILPKEHQHDHHNTNILPLLRCVGVSHCLRILTALLSEVRVVFCSQSAVRLTRCTHAALSILTTGGLSWQHVYIPVLSPGFANVLAAPYPYVIGILDEALLNQTDAVGEVLYVQLDQNILSTRNIPEGTLQERLPDIVLDTASSGDPNQHFGSPPEVLIQHILDILKADKKARYGDSALERVGETAAKAKEVLKKSFFKLRDRFQQRDNEQQQQLPVEAPAEPVSEDSMAADFIYTEGCHNETSEQEIRIAFTIFFLTFHGDVRWFLTNANGTVQLDRERFVRCKQGEYAPGSPMGHLAKNFCQTQLFQEFSKARIAAIGSQQSVGVEGSLFLQCEQYLRQKHMDFGIATSQRIARHIADSSPVRLTGMPQTNARQVAMNLTSSKALDSPETKRAIAQLVEQCRECSSVLPDVMSVIWARLRDCKGLQWKHGLLGLQLLRNLLYHGPLAAISEATDGLSKIRSLKFYENIRSQCAQQVQAAATVVYTLLVDRAKLFAIRRVGAELRRKKQQPQVSP